MAGATPRPPQSLNGQRYRRAITNEQPVDANNLFSAPMKIFTPSPSRVASSKRRAFSRASSASNSRGFRLTRPSLEYHQANWLVHA